jgi:hypothetical protein
MMKEDGLVFSRPMTQPEAELWIQNMEDHFGKNLITRKYEVQYAPQYFTESAATWWKMHQAIQGCNGAKTWEEFKKTLLRSRLIRKHYDNPKKKPCACKICGEIGHTYEEHKDGCPHCEGNHPAEECPTRQVTCFLCEGATHFTAQCQIYPKVQEVINQQKEALMESLEAPVMKEAVEDPDGEGLNRFFAQACYSCGEEGHFSQYCPKESQEYLGDFQTAEVKFDPQEIEALIITERPKKRRRRHPQNNPISAEKDLSNITCYRCKDLGYYADKCPEKKLKIQGAYIITKQPRDMSKVICFHCKEAGHFARECSDQMKAGAE